MERLVWHIVEGLYPEWHTHVIGPRGCREYLPPEVDSREVPIQPLWRFLLHIKLAALHQAFRLRPKLVIAGSGLTAPFAWLAARLVGARCMVYLHGLDVEARHPIYRLAWRPFFRHFDHVLVNSRFTRQLAVAAGVARSRISILHPGVTLPELAQANDQRTQFRNRYALGEVPLMLYVGRITARKGLADFIRWSLPNIIASVPAAKLVVIGDVPSGALLGSTDERARIDEFLHAVGLEHCVVFLGARAHDDPELDAAYFAADVSIFPVQQRPYDNEGFGMVAIEAAAHGLPTVAFDVGGIGDAVAGGISGELISPAQFEDFARAVCTYLLNSEEDRQVLTSSARVFATKFAWPEFAVHLRNTCRDITIATGTP
ncbi:glycosyltransferase family 4 protein [Acidihalobacter aeolianus]|nr:glycosyltransferase family 4 protein [Acidihalobacter aeolianus]